MRLVYTEKGDHIRKEMFREAFSPSMGPTPTDFTRNSNGMSS